MAGCDDRQEKEIPVGGQAAARHDLESAYSRIEIHYANKYLDALFGKNLGTDYLQTGEPA
ncbi:MAG: hypothetical protein LBF51_11035 [Zoogloeaceae bacterium]|nr:hypothetical protein [Zoogloeaceae bacterium]